MTTLNYTIEIEVHSESEWSQPGSARQYGEALGHMAALLLNSYRVGLVGAKVHVTRYAEIHRTHEQNRPIRPIGQ